MACTIFEVPIGSTSVYVEQDTEDKNLLGEQRLKLCLNTLFKYGNVSNLDLSGIRFANVRIHLFKDKFSPGLIPTLLHM